MVRRCDLARRQRSRKSRSIRMRARPASPPTTPPTTAGVLIELPPPPEPAPELAEDDGAEAVLPAPPMPPTAPPMLDAELVGSNVEVWVLEAANDEDVVREAVELPEVEERSVLEERLESPDEVKDTLLVKVGRELVEVTSVLFALKVENIGFMREESVDVVLAPDRVEAISYG